MVLGAEVAVCGDDNFLDGAVATEEGDGLEGLLVRQVAGNAAYIDQISLDDSGVF